MRVVETKTSRDDAPRTGHRALEDPPGPRELAQALHAALARALSSAGEIDVEMGACFRLLRRHQCLAQLGYARFADYVAERCGQSARWAELLAELHTTLEDFPVLRAALERGVLTKTKVLALGRVVVEATAFEWIGWAAKHGVRELRALSLQRGDRPPSACSRARAAAHASADDAASPAPEASTESNDEPEGAWVHIPAPPAVAHLYDYTLELVSRAAGESLSPAACIEAILAEFLCRSGASVSPELAAAMDAPRGQPETTSEETRSEARARSAAGARPGGAVDAFALDRELCTLVRMRQPRHALVMELLHQVKERGSYTRLGYRTFDLYCRDALDLSPRLVRELLWARRRLDALPAIAEAYRRGLGWAKVKLLLAIATPSTQRVWLGRARTVTTRYLAHETVAARRSHEENPRGDGPIPLPLSFVPPGAWPSPIRPGAGLWATEPPTAHGATAAGAAPNGKRGNGPDDEWRTFSQAALPCVIRFWLPRATHLLYSAVERDLRQREAPVGEGTKGKGPPSRWQCLFALLRHFLETWDGARREGWSRQRAVLDRDGYQCAVPGCRARRGLEVHHISFRSHGGGDEVSNLVTLCAVHHRLALHDLGGLRCRGVALENLRWTLGMHDFRGDVFLGASKGRAVA